MAAQKEYVIDAQGKSLGRVAAQAAKTLMGKTSPDYTPNVASVVKVTITNAGRISTTERKLSGKKYTSYSGYPGGIKTETLKALKARKGPTAALRRAVERMLPRNTMRVARMKNLTINA